MVESCGREPRHLLRYGWQVSERTPSSEARLAPGQLRETADRAIERALSTGAMQPIATELHEVAQEGIRFQVRVLGELHRKEAARRQQAAQPASNPFASPEPDLVVCGLTDTHVCLLNKFNVVDRHLLIVTRRFVDQDDLLDEADFEALALCMREIDGLAFYNGGVVAGASQQHKHLQLVPALGPGSLRAPIEAAMSAESLADEHGPLPVFGFVHALAHLRLAPEHPPARLAGRLLATYRVLLNAIGCDRPPARPYNILATRSWMLAVPRSREHFDTMSVNALGFAGSLLVRNRAQLDEVRRRGPLAVLAHVGIPR